MTYPILYMHNNKDIVAMLTFILSSIFSFLSIPHKKGWFLALFFRLFLKNCYYFFNFLKEFNSKIARNDHHELEILFHVLITLFLSADVSIVAFEKCHRKTLNVPVYGVHSNSHKGIDKTNTINGFLGQNWVYIVLFVGPLCHFWQSCEFYKIDNVIKKRTEPEIKNKLYELK